MSSNTIIVPGSDSYTSVDTYNITTEGSINWPPELHINPETVYKPVYVGA
jgi:hypothetical protein